MTNQACELWRINGGHYRERATTFDSSLTATENQEQILETARKLHTSKQTSRYFKLNLTELKTSKN